MKTIAADPKLIAFCGLYCGSCGAYLKEKCPGCRQNTKASWCKIRACGITNKYNSCADCREFADVKDCKKMNNAMAKIFSLIFGSDRPANIAAIKNQGADAYARYMAENKLQSIKRKKN